MRCKVCKSEEEYLLEGMCETCYSTGLFENICIECGKEYKGDCIIEEYKKGKYEYMCDKCLIELT